MAAPTKHVLRLRRTDNKSEDLLLNVAKEGRGDLDLKLIGTNKSELYVLSFAEADTKSYQDRNFKGNFEEWKTLLKFALLHRQPESTLPESLQGVETVAAINGSTATITIRKNVDGITQRLGTIHLQENTAATEIDIFDWVDTATAEAYDLRSQLEVLQASVESQKDAVAKLTTELDMLVRAKKEHEDELLSKFAVLLNAKKLKIRDQQRLLQGATIDPGTAEEVNNARSLRTSKKAGASRSGKRKAAAPPQSASSDHHEASDNDEEVVNASGDDASRHDQDTPDSGDADAAVATEDEDEITSHKSAALPVASQRTLRGRHKEAERMEVDDEPTSQQARKTRNLPSRAVKEPTPQPVSNAAEEEDDEETDDEL
ncbi:putative DNA repair protein XRCC4 [Septoria linicola]|nr:putative DNA repair protein XRCC4 [Septoria linicola]